jgi:exonuclease SbcD
MKILHTSDWHLGRSLYGRKRYEEFEAFLDWLAQTIDKLVEIARPFLGRFKVFPPTSTILEYFYTLLHGDLLHTPA